MFFACTVGKVDTVKYLLDNGVDPPTNESFNDLFDVSSDEIWGMMAAEFNQREKERNLAFAMATNERNTMSGHHLFPPEVMRIIWEQGHDNTYET